MVVVVVVVVVVCGFSGVELRYTLGREMCIYRYRYIQRTVLFCCLEFFGARAHLPINEGYM